MKTDTLTREQALDPFEEPLEEKLILNDTYFAAARDSVTVDGMEFSFLKPPYHSCQAYGLSGGADAAWLKIDDVPPGIDAA